MRIPIYNKATQLLIDAAIYAFAWVAAYQIRFDGQPTPIAYRQMLALMLAVSAGQTVASTLLGIYRFQWRYVNTEDALYIGRGYIIFSSLLLLVRILFGKHVPLLYVPLSIIAISFVLALGGAIGARLARRLLYQHSAGQVSNGVARRFLLVGAGSHGATLAREMALRNGIKIVGFVDDDPQKQGAVIAGVKVLGRTTELPRLVASLHVDEVLVCVAPKSRHLLHIDVMENGNGTPVHSRVIPTIEDLLDSASDPRVLAALNQPVSTNTDSVCAHSGAEPIAVGAHARGRGDGEVVHTVAASSGSGNSGTARHLDRLEVTVPIGPTTARSVIQGKSILITGGAGFIGSSVAERLVDHNHVILLDKLFVGCPIQYTSLLRHPNVTAVQGSILDADLRSLVKQADIVVHAAAILGVSRVCHAARETLETNYVGTSRLLKALDARPAIDRFVYFSTSEVFGVNSYRVDEASRPSIGPIAESRWSYAMSKLAGEHLVASYFRETHLPIAIVRPFNIFGPRRTGDYALRRFILNALQGEPLEIHDDGTQIRSWCYIDDFCSALLQMIVRPQAIGEDFNIGNPGNTLTICELAQKVIRLTGSSSKMVFCESPFPDISIRVPSLDKARRLLGYEPRYDLETGLKLTVQWHRENLAMMQVPAIAAAAAHVA